MAIKSSIAIGNKESDKLSTAGISVVYKANKLREAIKTAMKDDVNMKKAVHKFIFSGDPEAISPLQEIRNEHK